MSVIPRGSKYAAKFVLEGKQHWVDDKFGGEKGPWDTKKEARAAEAQYRLDLAESKRTGQSKVWTCSSWADHYEATELEEKAGTTQWNYRYALRRYREEFGDLPIRDLDRPTARAWARSVSQNVRDAIRSVHTVALNDGVVATNVFAALGIKKGESKGRVRSERLPSVEEYQRFLEMCEPRRVEDDGEIRPGAMGDYGPEMKRILMFAAGVGCRQGELFALTWDDLDVDRGLVHIHRARKADGSIGSTKGKVDEWVVVPAHVLEELESQDRRATDNFLFHSAEGRPLRKGTFNHQWEKLRQAAGSPNRRWHDWRHFCATQLLEAEVDHFAVSVQLTHQDGGTLVQERYGHPSHDRAKDRLRMGFGSLEIGSESGSDVPATGTGG